MPRNALKLTLAVSLLVLSTACGTSSTSADDKAFADFTKRTGIKVAYVEGGSGEMVQRVVRERSNPQADVLVALPPFIQQAHSKVLFGAYTPQGSGTATRAADGTWTRVVDNYFGFVYDKKELKQASRRPRARNPPPSPSPTPPVSSPRPRTRRTARSSSTSCSAARPSRKPARSAAASAPARTSRPPTRTPSRWRNSWTASRCSPRTGTTSPPTSPPTWAVGASPRSSRPGAAPPPRRASRCPRPQCVPKCRPGRPGGGRCRRASSTPCARGCRSR